MKPKTEDKIFFIESDSHIRGTLQDSFNYSLYLIRRNCLAIESKKCGWILSCSSI